MTLQCHHVSSCVSGHVFTVEPKYADPLSGAPPTFQQRIAEINALEQETIRTERARKFKKKTKSET